MGLDMYLYTKRYLSTYGDSAPECNIIKDLSGLQKFDEDNSSIEVMVTSMYWRKANQIHNWFVDNIQDGKDDCGLYYVNESALVDLKNICDEILKNPSDAAKLLPPRSGFFFGSTDVDEWYMNQIIYTSERIGELLKAQEEDGGWVSFYYSSSW